MASSMTRHKFETSNLLVNQAFGIIKVFQHLGIVLLGQNGNALH